MNRIKISIFAVCAIFVFTCAAAQAKELKIGYADLPKVFEDYNKTKDAKKKLEEKGKAKDAQRQKLRAELKKLEDEQSLMSDKAKAEKQGAINAKRKEVEEFERSARDEFMKEYNESLTAIRKDIEVIVNGYAKESGYDMIVDSRMLLYSDEKYDVTAELLKKLNK